MFTEVIVEFNKRLDTLQEGQDRITHLLEELFNQMEDQKTLAKYTKRKTDETADRFMACAKGFRQTRDACELLRDELSTAAGTMISNSWHDDADMGL